MKVIFNNSESFIKLRSYGFQQNLVHLIAPDLVWDLGGFKLYEDDEQTMVFDGSDFIYKWNIHNEIKDGVVLTNSETWRDIPKVDLSPHIEFEEPLTNEELTVSIADLMYEISMIKLGMEDV